jgi:hypothetical protein
MNAVAHTPDTTALYLPKDRKTTSIPRPTKLAAATVGYDRLPAQESTVSWLTPPELIWGSPREEFTGLGPFDLDPCTPKEGMPWPTAKLMLTEEEDGLTTPWNEKSFFYMNPPFGKGQESWMQKASSHPGGGIALVFARTETRWFQRHVFKHPCVSAIVFQQGRLAFHRVDGTLGKAPPCGAVWIGYGPEAARRLKLAVDEGLIRGTYLDMSQMSRVATDLEAANHE